MAEKKTKKKARKNSNYKKVVKYVSIDQLLKKSLCDYRNYPEADPSLGRNPEADRNKYEKCVNFCTVAGIITKEERETLFDGKIYQPMTAEEMAEFTGIPIYQIEKNDFAFKVKTADDFVRASMIRLALCDLVGELIDGMDPETEVTVDDEAVENAACYINFCMENGVLTQDQSLDLYLKVRQGEKLDMPFISSLTGLDVEVLEKMAQA